MHCARMVRSEKCPELRTLPLNFTIFPRRALAPPPYLPSAANPTRPNKMICHQLCTAGSYIAPISLNILKMETPAIVMYTIALPFKIFLWIPLAIYTDVDECNAGTDNCAEQALCMDTDGSFTCTCNTGYTGDGMTCSGKTACHSIAHFNIINYYFFNTKIIIQILTNAIVDLIIVRN